MPQQLTPTSSLYCRQFLKAFYEMSRQCIKCREFQVFLYNAQTNCARSEKIKKNQIPEIDRILCFKPNMKTNPSIGLLSTTQINYYYYFPKLQALQNHQIFQRIHKHLG